MALIKFSDIFTLDRLNKDRIDTLCENCHVKKPIPKVRMEKNCDECIEEQIKLQDENERKTKLKVRYKDQRIPERYWGFDQKRLEIPDFDEMCAPGFSWAVSGEVGTGKTNLACQILIARRTGYFYSANELTRKITEKIEDESLLVIDDLTELNATSETQIDAIRKLFHHRYGQQKDTIITLSKSYDELERIFGDSGRALVSRFRQWMTPVTLKMRWR